MVGQELRYTAAHSQSRQNFNRNIDALAASQKWLVEQISGGEPDVEWVYGRDGALSARHGKEWISGSSLPLKTAQSILAGLEAGAQVACFLNPTHAAQLRVALERMSLSQALVAVIADTEELRLFLGCEDFESEIAAGRLWFAVGTDWASEMARIFVENDGLPTPGQFIRTSLTPAEAINRMITAAQEVFARENVRRAGLVKAIHGACAPGSFICAIAPATFRLWDDGGHVLEQLAATNGWYVLNPDDPKSASAMALARRLSGCGAVVSVNAARAQLAGVSERVRVVSWMTIPRIPEPHPGDGLLVAQAEWKEAAIAAGWAPQRVEVAGWPVHVRHGKGKYVALIAHTNGLATPAFELSSHRVLWEMIATELTDNPFAFRGDIERFFSGRIHRVGIAEETLDKRRFMEKLILPAHQQSLVRLLSKSGINVRVYGKGWEQVPDLQRFCGGECATREDLAAALESAAALLHGWPGLAGHPVECCGRPVVYGNNTAEAIEMAMAALAGRVATPKEQAPITAQAIDRLLS